MKFKLRPKIEEAIANHKGRKKSIYINGNMYKVLQKEVSDFEGIRVVLYNKLKVMINKKLNDWEVVIK